MLITNFLFFLSVNFSLSTTPFFNSSKNIPGYDLKHPDKTLILPDILNEISGLTDIDSTTVGCVQDENGILFIYDVITNRIRKQYNFHIDGDYEGITRIENTIYILRSDGVVFKISNYNKSYFKLDSIRTGIPAGNNEGLCYDADNNRLLIACKGKIGKGPEYKDLRVIYGLDLSSGKLSKEPVFTFDVADVKKFVTERKLNVPSRTKKKGEIKEPIVKFMTSAIAIHPFTKKLFLLSAADHLFFIFDSQGNIEHIEQLNPSIFNKAEGITFFANGDLLITNEAQNKKPTLLRFRYLGK